MEYVPGCIVPFTRVHYDITQTVTNLFVGNDPVSFRGMIVSRTRLLCLDDDRHLMKLGGWFVWNVFQRILLALRNDTGSFPTNRIGVHTFYLRCIRVTGVERNDTGSFPTNRIGVHALKKILYG